MRVSGDDVLIHRYAQALLVAVDFINNYEGYDFHTGSLLIPQITRLGALKNALKDVKGDVRKRQSKLHQGNSAMVDSTIFELLVAGSFSEMGRKVEMLDPTNERTPDFRIIDNPIPTVVECKRRRWLFEYERSEYLIIRPLFSGLQDVCQQQGIKGVFDVSFTRELREVSSTDFVAAVRRTAKFGIADVGIDFGWGTLKFKELPKRMNIKPTPLYSASFLREVFSWDTEMTENDGLVCFVDPPSSLLCDRAIMPLALKWRSDSEEARRKRARSVKWLLKEAFDQVPSGEMGILYLCYQEGMRTEIANARTQQIFEEIRSWHHRWGILVPAIFINRILPRQLGDGKPDLIENVLPFRPDYADATIFDDLPSLVFTSPIRN